MADRKVHRCRCQECRSRKTREVKEYHWAINRVIVELDERSRRLFAGVLVGQWRRGGIERVVEITGLSRMTVRRGLRECEQTQAADDGRIRRAGGGRKSIEKKKIRELLTS